MNLKIITTAFLVSLSLFSSEQFVFEKGSGAEYKIKFQDKLEAQVSIYLADVKEQSISIEYFFSNIFYFVLS